MLPFGALRLSTSLKNVSAGELGPLPYPGLTTRLRVRGKAHGPRAVEELWPASNGSLVLDDMDFRGLYTQWFPTRLPAGDSIRTSRTYGGVWDYDGQTGVLFPRPGPYTLEVEYGNESDAWKKTVVEVMVPNLRGDDLEVYRTLEGDWALTYAMMSNSEVPEKGVRERIAKVLREHPKSAYADYARFALARANYGSAFTREYGVLTDTVRMASIGQLRGIDFANFAYGPEALVTLRWLLEDWEAPGGGEIDARLQEDIPDLGEVKTRMKKEFADAIEVKSYEVSRFTLEQWEEVKDQVRRPAVSESSLRLAPNRVLSSVFATNSLAFSPSGRYLACTAGQGWMRIWGTPDFRGIEVPFGGSHKLVNWLKARESDTLIFATSLGQSPWRWELRTGQAGPLLPSKGWIGSMALDSSGRYLLIGSGGSTRDNIHLWDIPDAKRMRSYRGHRWGTPQSLAFSPDGKQFASTRWREDAILWNVSEQEAVGRLYVGYYGANSVTFSPDGEHPVTRRGDEVTIEFATKGYCDVTIVIEDATGKIIRHLASGALGEDAPPPLQEGTLEQTVVWDGKDDQGVYIDDKNACTVRVSLGLKPQFERSLFWTPKRRPSFDAPLKPNFLRSTPLTSGTSRLEHEHAMNGSAASALAVRGDRLALAYPDLNRLATDGGSGGLPLQGPPTALHVEVDGESQAVPPTSVAALIVRLPTASTLCLPLRPEPREILPASHASNATSWQGYDQARPLPSAPTAGRSI